MNGSANIENLPLKYMLGPPLGGGLRILVEGLVKLISRFAEVPNCSREVFGVVWKNPGKFIAAGLAEVLFLEGWVSFLTSGNDSIEKVAAHKLVIGDTVKFRTFHAVVGI